MRHPAADTRVPRSRYLRIPHEGDDLPLSSRHTGGVTRDPTSPAPTPDTLAPPHPVIPAWVGDVIAAVLIVAVAFAPLPGPEFRPDGWAQLALVVAPAALLPFRRRWPVSVLLVCLALYGVAAWIGLLSPGIGLGVAIAMFGVANRSTRRRTVIIGAITVVIVFVFSIPAAVGSVFDPRVFQFVFAVAFAAAAGDGARSRRAYIAAITERAERAEQTREAEARRRVTEERLRLARDLHDAVAHQIAVISLNAGVASSALPGHPERAAAALGTIRGAARTVLGEIGGLLAMLRADDPDDGVDAPQVGLERLPDLLDQFRSTGLDVQVRIEGGIDQATGAVGIVAYRVIQEALTNVHKHGAEHRAHVLIDVGTAALRVVVTNPVHARSARGGAGTGVGLIGLRERVGSVRGSVHAGPAPGGWRLSAILPLTKEGAP
ncbi:Sensor histidine kinase LiaS [Microbacterium trichothecenolyticum]|uniref:histidine kinase n=1 Tax=Microbacterium trichothecenolyticum TaxID=69370 RepID=A0A0M2HAG6_MICTR|nr:Sensor histidine kinase LiaS [Microbacterium trichothecenolyticum]